MGKLCKDQLIGKLVALLREADPEKFDDAVVEARNQLTAEPKQAKRTDLEKLFGAQIATLKDRGTPEQIVEVHYNQSGSVIAKALSVWEEKYPNETLEQLASRGIYLMLPVTPRSWRGPYDLMAMVRNGGKVGYTYLNPTQISDVVDAPQEPYYIYDVEDGSSIRGKSPENAEKILKQQKRSPLTAAEVMALTTHTDVLSRHYVWAPGSRYGSADGVPCVYLAGGDRPKLDWSYVDNSNDRWGSASCGSR